MKIPKVTTITLSGYQFKPADTLVTVEYVFTSGDTAELIPYGSSQGFPITGVRGQIEIPIGAHYKCTVRTADIRTDVTLRPVSSR